MGVWMIHSNGGGQGGGGLAIPAAISPWLAVVLVENDDAADCLMSLDVIVINSLFFFDLLAVDATGNAASLFLRMRELIMVLV